MAATCALLAITLASNASAASGAGPVYWTVAQARKAMLAGSGGENIWTFSQPGVTPPFEQAPYFELHSVACAGHGRPKSGAYDAFLCTIRWGDSSDAEHTLYTNRLWTRIWSYRGGTATCASQRSLVDCPPPAAGKMLPGDPRANNADTDGFMVAQAENLTKRAWAARGEPIANIACSARSYFVIACTYFDGAGAGTPSAQPNGLTIVSWTKGKTHWAVRTTVRS